MDSKSSENLVHMNKPLGTRKSAANARQSQTRMLMAGGCSHVTNGDWRWKVGVCCVEWSVSRLDPLGQYSAKVHNVAAPKGGEEAATTHKQAKPKTRTELQ